MHIDYTRPFLYNYQKRIIDSSARYTVTEAATKTGKTASHIIWLFEQPLVLNLKRGQSCWWVAPVYSQAEMAFNRLRRQVTVNKFFEANISKLSLTYPTGAELHFKSAEKPDNLYGDDVYAAVFDEFTRSREEAWYALRSTLTKTNGKCKFIGNVKGRKNWGYRLAQKAKAGEPNFEYFKITSHDAVKEGLITEAEVMQAKRDLPDNVFKELYEAEPSEDGANPFGMEYIKRQIRGLSGGVPVVFGIDLAKSVDFTVIIGLDSNGYVCKLERFQADWERTKWKILEVCENIPTVVDSTGVGDPIVESLQQYRQSYESFKFTSISKQQIMEGLAAGIQQGKTSVLEGVHRQELESYEYEYTRTGVRYTCPPGLHDDTVCAHAMAFYKFSNKPSGRYNLGFA